MLYVLVLIVHIIVSLFMVFIILIQSGKGEGLADVFGGGGSSQTTIFGARTGNFLTRGTTVAAILFMVTCLSLTLLSRQKEVSVMQRELFRRQVEDAMRRQKEPDAPVAQDAVIPVTPDVSAPQQPSAPTGDSGADSTAPDDFSVVVPDMIEDSPVPAVQTPELPTPTAEPVPADALVSPSVSQ